MTLYCLKNKKWNLFISVLYGTDRLAHMFYRLIDPKHPIYDKDLAIKLGNAIKNLYKSMDETIGKVYKLLPENTLFMALSDHGFHSFRVGININSWLAENGYIYFNGQKEGEPPEPDMWTDEDFFQNVDWNRTKAYSLGLGLIFINLKGRERNGIVEPGDEYRALCKEIANKLKQLKDPDTGENVVDDVFIGYEIYKGERTDDAPDLVVGFKDGYRVSWHTALGAIPYGVFEVNDKKWSGDHCSADPRKTKGIFLCNRKINSDLPGLVDIAPTVLSYFNLPYDKGKFDGKDLLH